MTPRAPSLPTLLLAALTVGACADGGPAPPTIETHEADMVSSATARAHAHEGGVLTRKAFAIGENIWQITAGISQPCSINTGLAFDGTNLVMSCWNNPNLDVIDPQDGTLLNTVTPVGYNGFGAMAWNRSTGTLWACASGGAAGFMNVAVEIDLSTGDVLSSFPVPDTCTDGLAYDGVDNTLWTSGDVYTTLYQYDLTGAELQQVNIGGNIGTGNSGIAIGGQSFYLANNGLSQIYEVDRAFTTYTLFAGFERRIEDLECDDVTFAPDAAVIWQQDAYDRIVNAFEIEAGACPFGGGGGPLEILIDVKPGSWPNSINTESKNGLTPVAVLTDENFDASILDPTTATLGNDDGADTPVATRNNGSLHAELEDVDGDGDLDLILHFSTPELVANGDLGPASEALVLNIEDYDGTAYRGEDAVRPVH